MSTEDELRCKELRKEIFLTAYHGGTTHLASSYSCLEILYTLYFKGILKFDPQNPNMLDRDRLILSKGHAALALYTVLSKCGFFDKEILTGFLKPDGKIGGEPVLGDIPGIEATTGSLGHGLSVGVGMALAQRKNNISARTFVILGDGEIEEGSVWESAMSASTFQLDNLTAILDANGLQKMTYVDKTVAHTAWKAKWEAFGWDVSETDGHDIDELFHSFNNIGNRKKPNIIICHTVKGKGVSIMENSDRWHFRLPVKKKELECFMDELGISEEGLS